MGGCDGAQSAGERGYPTSEVRGGGREELPRVQGAVAMQGPEGLKGLFHIQGPEELQ